MKKSIAVIGLGRFGLTLVEALSKQDIELIALDEMKERVEMASAYTNYALICDSTDEEALREVGIQNVDHVVIAIGQDFEVNVSRIMITIIKLKKIGIENITVRLDDETFAEAMTLIGASEIIYPLKIASERLANRISSNTITDYFNMTNDFDAYEVILKDNFKTLPLVELNSRTKYLINILLITRNGQKILPSRDDLLKAGDKVILFGNNKDINKIVKFLENYILKK